LSLKKITIAIFGLIISLPLLLWLTPFGFQNKTEFETIFKRSKSEITWDTKNLTKTNKSITNYAIDNFRYRQKLVGFNALLNKNFKISSDLKIIVQGKDGWLFLGNGYNSVVKKSLGEEVMSADLLKNWNLKFTKLQSSLSSKNIQFCIAVVPNKHTIYSEHLPNGLVARPVTNYSMIMELNHLNLVDLKKKYLENKKPSPLLYYKSDSHWSEYGAFLAYQEICNSIGISNENQIDIRPNQFEQSEYRYGYGLANMQGLIGKVNDYKQFNAHDKKALSDNVTFKSFNTKDLYQPISHNYKFKQGIKISVNNKEAKNEKTVLIVGDSFRSRIAPYMNQTFSEIHYLHWHDFEATDIMNTVNKLNPDIVIYQVVERSVDWPNHIRLIE